MVIHFAAAESTNIRAEPLILHFPIIVTDFPPEEQSVSAAVVLGGGDEGTAIDLDLPEYTPRYELQPSSPPSPSASSPAYEPNGTNR